MATRRNALSGLWLRLRPQTALLAGQGLYADDANTGIRPMTNDSDIEIDAWNDEEQARTTAVDSEYCVWCKGTVNEDAVSLSTGESLCRTCLGDMREWIRYQQIRFYHNPNLGETPLRIITDAWQKMQYDLTLYYDDVDEIFPDPYVRHDADHLDDYYEPPQG